jgi:hypothetical protein
MDGDHLATLEKRFGVLEELVGGIARVGPYPIRHEHDVFDVALSEGSLAGGDVDDQGGPALVGDLRGRVRDDHADDAQVQHEDPSETAVRPQLPEERGPTCRCLPGGRIRVARHPRLALHAAVTSSGACMPAR